MQSVQKIDPDFVNLYETTRAIGKDKVRARSIEVTIKSAESNTALIHAAVTINGTKIKGKTDNNGMAVLKPGNKKEMDVIVTKEGFKPATQRVDFILGERS